MTAFLILVTWIAWGLATVGVGSLLAGLVFRAAGPRALLQASIWTGALALFLFTLMLNFVAGLAGTLGVLLVSLWLVGGCLAFGLWAICHRRDLNFAISRSMRLDNWPALLVALVAFSGLVAAAFFATGEPMDADAGIYRMGAINYAADFRVVPGLANLHDRFGFNSALWPIAALFENGLWATNGFRIVTGFFLLLMVLDLLFRIVVPRERTPGDYYTVLALAFIGWIILSDTGRWLPSPAQDIVAFVLFSVAVAYVLDFIKPSTRTWVYAAVGVIAASLAGAVRPLGWLLVPLGLVAMGLALRLGRAPGSGWPGARLVLSVTGGASLLLVALVVRDIVLSGWVLFPLDAFPVPVDWQAPEPTLTSRWITAYARDPTGDASVVLASNSWIAKWVPTFLNSREARVLTLAVGAAIIPLFWRTGRHAWRQSMPNVAIGLIPVFGALLAWFVTAPDVRFGWGALFGVCAVPLAVLLSFHAYPAFMVRMIFCLVLLLGVADNVRIGKFDLRGGEPAEHRVELLGRVLVLKLADAPAVEVYPGRLGDGTPVTYAVRGGCYNVFPLCLLPDSGSQVRKRGESIQDGFQLIEGKSG